jgi:hypothetical protein
MAKIAAPAEITRIWARADEAAALRPPEFFRLAVGNDSPKVFAPGRTVLVRLSLDHVRRVFRFDK